MVCRPNSRSLAVSQGKGIDLDAARASGLMESIELFHAERIHHPLKLATWNELRFSHNVVGPDTLPRTTGSLFGPDVSLLWIAGVDLFGSGQVWIPYELAHTNHRLPLPTGTGCFVMTSNGLASGNVLQEAVVHGLCEVIERDAMTLFLLRTTEEQDRLRVTLETITDPECRRVLERFENAGVAVGIWDVTSDVGIAAFRCVVVDAEPNPFRPLGPIDGMGCHLVREIALLRALTEAAQARLTVIAGSRDDNGRERYSDSQSETRIRRTRQKLREPGARRFSDVPTRENPDCDEDIACILNRLRAVALEQAVVVDLTKPELGIPVARVVVPGLEPSHRVEGAVPGPRAAERLRARGLRGKS
jgi:ribosomal protein S12 methylthiotransferase accessory factor